MVKRISEAPPQLMARMAGVLFLLLVLTAAFTEFFARGKLSSAMDLAAVMVKRISEEHLPLTDKHEHDERD